METECIPNGDKFMSLFGIHFLFLVAIWYTFLILGSYSVAFV